MPPSDARRRLPPVGACGAATAVMQLPRFFFGGTSMLRMRMLGLVALVAVLATLTAGSAGAQPPKPGVKGYEVEWVYRVRYGFIDEWWDLFRKYQLPILDRAKELGYILD